MHVHHLTLEEHREFLEEERNDPITGEILEAGDEVVVCASCKSAFLKDSWEYLGKRHCGQSRTLREIPIFKNVALKPQSTLGEVRYEASLNVKDPRKHPLEFMGGFFYPLIWLSKYMIADVLGWGQGFMYVWLTIVIGAIGGLVFDYFRRIYKFRSVVFLNRGIEITRKKFKKKNQKFRYAQIKSLHLQINKKKPSFLAPFRPQAVIRMKVTLQTGEEIWTDLSEDLREARTIKNILKEFPEQIEITIEDHSDASDQVDSRFRFRRIRQRTV
ncbi:MAG: hypothetical protein AAF740_06925 [Bacteroidota bacterium]